MRTLVTALVFVLLGAAPAGAAQFGEQPFLPVAGDATCLRATGAPGELVRSTPAGAQLIEASRAGLHDTAAVTLGTLGDGSPQAAARPNGAAVLAHATGGDEPQSSDVWVATRDTGGGWSPAQRLGGGVSPAVAETDAGDALVAWIEILGGRRYAVRVARRTAGGAFAAPATLASGRNSDGVMPTVALAAAANGETVALWSQPSPTGQDLVVTAIAPAGGAFASTRRVGRTAPAAAPVLTVAPDGRALAAFWTGRHVLFSERPPGGAFGGPSTLAQAADELVTVPVAAIGTGGAAVVGWQDVVGQDVHVAVRPAAGGFGRPIELAPRRPQPRFAADSLFLLNVFAPPGGFGPIGLSGIAPDGDGGNLRALVTADGRALLTWGGLGSASNPVIHVATVGFAGGLDTSALTDLRVPASATALTLADGGHAVAWADDRDDDGGAGRVHLAIEGAAGVADGPAPVARLGEPLHRVLRGPAPLELPVTCRAACDVRLVLVDHPEVVATATLAKAGRTVVKLAPMLRPFAPLKRGPVRVRLTYGAPGATRPAERVVAVVIRRLPGKPITRVLGLRAVRRGAAIEVSWRTAAAASTDDFIVSAAGERPPERQLLGFGSPRGASHRFSARIRAGRDARFVTVRVFDEFFGTHPVTTKVR